MGITSAQTSQGRENPLIASLKYANDAIKQSFQLMQNAKELSLREKEMNATKQINMFNSLTKMYNDAAASAGPVAAFSQYGEALASVMSAMGMSDGAIAAWSKGMAEAPLTQLDIMTAINDRAARGLGRLEDVTPKDVADIAEESLQKRTAAGEGSITASGFTSKGIEKDVMTLVKPETYSRLNELKYRLYQEFVNVFKPNAEGKVLENTLNDPALQKQYNTFANTLVNAAFLNSKGELQIDAQDAQVLKNYFRLQSATTLDSNRALMDRIGTYFNNQQVTEGWAAGKDIPLAPSFPFRGEVPPGAMAARAGLERKIAIEGDVAGAGQALGMGASAMRQQAKVRAAETTTPQVAVNVKLPGQGPPPDVANDEAKLAVWQQTRANEYWMKQKDVGGIPMTQSLANSLAAQEALIPTRTYTEPKPNVPVNPRESPPAKYSVSEAKKSMVPPFVGPDAIDDKTSYRAGKSIYDWWAKRMAGVEFGKGDEIRLNKSLSNYMASLPTAEKRYAEISDENYFRFLGGGDVAKGQQMFVAQVNTEAFNATTSRMGEERMEKTMTVSKELADLVLMPDLANKKLDTAQFNAIVQLAQVKAVTGGMAEFSKTMQGSLLMSAYDIASKALQEPMTKVTLEAKGDPNKIARGIEALRSNPYYKGYLDVLSGLVSYTSGGVFKMGEAPAQGIVGFFGGKTPVMRFQSPYDVNPLTGAQQKAAQMDPAAAKYYQENWGTQGSK